jgi:O-antigen/teichoic acid export membrane protein
MVETSKQRNSAQRYMAELMAAMLGYAVVLIASIWWISREPESSTRWLVALLPMLPVLLGARAILRFFGRMDELGRRQLKDALAFAFATSALLVLTLGFLQVAGLPDFSVWWVWVGMGVLWIIGSLVTALRYR